MSSKQQQSTPPPPVQRSRFMAPLAGTVGEKAKDFKGTIKEFFRYIKEYRVALLLVIIFAALSAVFTVAAPYFLGEIMTGLVQSLESGSFAQYRSQLTDWLLVMIILYILSAILAYIHGFITATVTMQLTYKMRRDIMTKINRLPFKYFDGTTHGEVLSRLTNDVDVIGQALSQSLATIITSITSVVGIIVMMFIISPPLAGASIAVLPVSFGLMILVIKKSQKYFKGQFASLGKVNGYIEEMFTGLNIVKSFTAEKKVLSEFDDKNQELYKVSWRANFYSGIMMPMTAFIGNLAYVVVCVVGAVLVAGGEPFGTISAFIIYIRNFNQSVGQSANISGVLQQTAAATERVFDFLKAEEESPDAEKLIETKKLKGIVTFENVSFGYVKEKRVINDFSFYVEEGKKIAIVGPTGAGKTTIVKLLMRFYDLDTGKILIDSNDITQLTRRQLRGMFGMVLQDTWLYNDTIMENIRFGRSSATDEEVVAAATAAFADNFIRALPDGYNMVLNEDATNISQGQKQLLTIARAILRDPKILILDEATSSIDTRTEHLIQNAMDTLMKNRTSFVIAHRLSTIKNADTILVLDKGDIIESGSHKQLMELGGFYSELYKSQFTIGVQDAGADTDN